MGVFKEFLEETLSLAFNPALNLFKVLFFVLGIVSMCVGYSRFY